MQNHLRILVTCCIIAFGSLAQATSIHTDTIKIFPPDTVPPNFAELEELLEEDSVLVEPFELIEDESACAILNCDLYQAIWDTTRINPYGLDLRLKKDTTKLNLIHNSSCDYAHPACGDVTSEFGFRKYRYHYGIDINLETGDAVLAAFEGTVRVARFSPTYGYYVIIRHVNGLETLYAHLSQLSVSSGEYLQAGEVVGLGGNTGRSRGSHLHFEVRFLGQQLNPRDVINFEDYACLSRELMISAKNFEYLSAAAKHKAELSARKYHKIRKGDSLGKIAKRYRTSVAKLCKLNKISKRTKLKPGRKIRVS